MAESWGRELVLPLSLKIRLALLLRFYSVANYFLALQKSALILTVYYYLSDNYLLYINPLVPGVC